MHRPFVTTVKFENEDGGALRLHYAVAAADTADAKQNWSAAFSISKSTTTRSRGSSKPPRCRHGC